jgi:pimeloyl-ACP methyl ester carboxylesterase
VAEARDTLADAARSLRVPTLLVHGEASPVLDARDGRALRQIWYPASSWSAFRARGTPVAGDKPEEF